MENTQITISDSYFAKQRGWISKVNEVRRWSCYMLIAICYTLFFEVK